MKFSVPRSDSFFILDKNNLFAKMKFIAKINLIGKEI